MDLNLLSYIYLPLGLVFSFLFSFLYLRRYPKDGVKFSYYFTIFVFGLVIFNVFLVPYDIAVAGYIKQNNITDFTLFENLDVYYLIFGFVSQILGDIISPIMVYIEISGFYNKCDITLEVLKSFFTDFLGLIKIIVVLLVSIPTTINFTIEGKDSMEILKMILLYANLFPYLKILYYIGFVTQDIVYSVLKKRYNQEWRFFDLWKLGKIYKHYFREREIVNKRYDEIVKDLTIALDDYKMEIPNEFMIHCETFKANIEATQQNLLFLVSEKESVFDATKKHQESEIQKNNNENKLNYDPQFYKKMFDYVDKEEKVVQRQVENDNSMDVSVSDLDSSISEDYYDDEYDEYEGMSEEELKQQLGSDYEVIMEKRKKKLLTKNSDIIAPIHVEEKLVFKEKKFQNFTNLKNFICGKMTKAIEASISVQRKSHLLSAKGLKLMDERNHEKTYSNWMMIPIILYMIVFAFFELPFNIYNFFPKKIKGFVFDLIFGILSTLFYFYIFNYATINHKLISGDLIYGKHKSGNVNFYKFISFVLCFSDALFFHSVWVMKKNKEKAKSDVKYFEVFNLPEVPVLGVDIIPYISVLIILVSIFNAAKFSVIKLKIKKCKINKPIILFNENSDFFYNESNLFSNFILGCGVLYCINKNMDRILQIIADDIN